MANAAQTCYMSGMETIDPVAELRVALAAAASNRAWAREHGFSLAYVQDVLAGRRPASGRMLEALDLEAVILRKRRAAE